MGEAQANDSVQEVVLEDLARLVRTGCEETELAGCSSLLATVLAEFQPPLEVTPGGGVTLLGAVLTRVADKHRRRALAEIEDYRRQESGQHTSFQVAAAAELMRVPDDDALYEQALAFRRQGHLTGVSWEKMLNGQTGSMAERRRRAAIWAGLSNIRDTRRHQQAWLKKFLAAIKAHVGDTAVQAELLALVSQPAAETSSPASNGRQRTSVDPITDASAADSTPQSPRTPRRRRHLLVSLVVVVALLVAGVVAINAWKDSPSSAAEAPALRVTILRLLGTGSEFTIGYPDELKKRAAAVVNRLDHQGPPLYDDLDAFLREELVAGAFMLRRLEVRVELEGLSDSEVTVHDITVEQVERPIPVAAVIERGPAGSGSTPRILVFNMNEQPSVAREELLSQTGQVSPPFFDVERIGLPRGHKETLIFRFSATARASEFTVDLHYEANGELKTKRIDLDGKPFRVAPLACRNALSSDKASARDVTKIGSLRYGVARLLAETSGDRPTVRKPGPNDFCSQPYR